MNAIIPGLRAAVCGLALGLSACGGGGGDGGASEAPATTTTAPAPQPATVATPPSGSSSKLVDNALASNASFDNYFDARIVVPVRSTAFVSTNVYVKLTRADGELLFLGAVPWSEDFQVPVQLPLSETTLLYQIFTDSANDEIVFGEINL